MFCTLLIIRYPKFLGFFGFLSMLFFRFPLLFAKKIKFWKLMGSGKGGTFNIRPDLNQWAILFTGPDQTVSTPSFIRAYCRFFHCDLKQFVMKPIAGHGLWDGKQIFGSLSKSKNCDGPVAVLTRATIRLSSLWNFWENVPGVARKLDTAEGLLISYGLGEMPLRKQATFSIWEDETSMKTFAYRMQEHAEVIRKTRQENWYKEELFVRFHIISVTGLDEKIATKLSNLRTQYEEA